MKYVLGVDGGGTKTHARLCQVGPGGCLCLVHAGHAGGSNPYSVGWEAAQQNLRSAIAEATSAVEVDSAVLAVAGCGSLEARDRLAAWANVQNFAKRVRVVSDTEPVLAETPRGETAIGLIAGTGSVALARSSDGQTEVVGGWGYLIDDGGSGYAIGRDALRAVAAAADTSDSPTLFARAVLEAAGVTKAVQLKAKLYGAADPRAWTAGLAPAVLQRAGQGDAEAESIVDAAASALTRLAVNTAKHLDSKRPPIQLAGGVIQRSTFYRTRVVERLVDAGWDRSQIAPAPDAACVCAHLAWGTLA